MSAESVLSGYSSQAMTVWNSAGKRVLVGRQNAAGSADTDTKVFRRISAEGSKGMLKGRDLGAGQLGSVIRRG